MAPPARRNVNVAYLECDHKRFQFREQPHSTKTVKSIAQEGIDAAKWDPIPVIRDGKRYIVAGDGHSRLKALQLVLYAIGERSTKPVIAYWKEQMAEGRLPREWYRRSPPGWLIPVRIVQEKDALKLAYAANMNRAPFTAYEEGRIFKARIDRGETLAAIARSSHCSVGYVTNRMYLTVLITPIRRAIGEEWGIDVDKALVLGELFTRHDTCKEHQRQLWDDFISKGDWTRRSLRLFLLKVLPKLAGDDDDAGGAPVLFKIPRNAGRQVAKITATAQERRKLRRALQCLLSCPNVLADVPQLEKLINRHGDKMLDQVLAAEKEDADVLAALVY